MENRSPKAPPSPATFFVQRGDTRMGPFTSDQLAAARSLGGVSGDDLVIEIGKISKHHDDKVIAGPEITKNHIPAATIPESPPIVFPAFPAAQADSVTTRFPRRRKRNFRAHLILLIVACCLGGLVVLFVNVKWPTVSPNQPYVLILQGGEAGWLSDLSETIPPVKAAIAKGHTVLELRDFGEFDNGSVFLVINDSSKTVVGAYKLDYARTEKSFFKRYAPNELYPSFPIYNWKPHLLTASQRNLQKTTDFKAIANGFEMTEVARTPIANGFLTYTRVTTIDLSSQRSNWSAEDRRVLSTRASDVRNQEAVKSFRGDVVLMRNGTVSSPRSVASKSRSAAVTTAKEKLISVARRMGGNDGPIAEEVIELVENDIETAGWNAMDNIMTEVTPETRAAYREYRSAVINSGR
jgi:hypothetical protein